MALQISLCVLVLISVITFICLRITKSGVIALLAKTVASMLFVAYGVFSLVNVTYFKPIAVCFILMGLLCGLIGDIVLDLKVIYPEHDKIYLNAGMVSFGIGHVFYLLGAIFFSAKVFNLMWPLLIGVIVAVVLTPVIYFVSTRVLKLNFGKFLVQTLAYTFVLLFMCGFSVYMSILAQEFIIYAGGILLIFISDLVLSMNYFGKDKQDDKFLVITNHALYYAGQILMATFLFLF